MTQQAIFPAGLDAAAIPMRLSPAILSHGHIFLTGVTGSGERGDMPSEPQTQFRAVFDKIQTLLLAAGTDFGAVVEMTSYHIDIQKHFEMFEAVHADYVRAPFPAWTAVEVAGLRRPGALVEVRVIARG